MYTQRCIISRLLFTVRPSRWATVEQSCRLPCHPSLQNRRDLEVPFSSKDVIPPLGKHFLLL